MSGHVSPSTAEAATQTPKNLVDSKTLLSARDEDVEAPEASKGNVLSSSPSKEPGIKSRPSFVIDVQTDDSQTITQLACINLLTGDELHLNRGDFGTMWQRLSEFAPGNAVIFSHGSARGVIPFRPRTEVALENNLRIFATSNSSKIPANWEFRDTMKFANKVCRESWKKSHRVDEFCSYLKVNLGGLMNDALRAEAALLGDAGVEDQNVVNNLIALQNARMLAAACGAYFEWEYKRTESVKRASLKSKRTRGM
ncbi:unnamed protein product [Amoebophrya sp. A25]|nr:unnamed protein product [Amoebophrya sp. A25]|eukprot:GSA25T00012594001.1